MDILELNAQWVVRLYSKSTYNVTFQMSPHFPYGISI